MVDFNRSDEDLVRKDIQALRQLGPAPDGDDTLKDANILNLTTVQGLVDQVNTGKHLSAETPLKKREAIEAIRFFERRSLLTNQNVIDANTFAGLITLILANANLSASELEITTTYYGGTQYQGNDTLEANE